MNKIGIIAGMGPSVGVKLYESIIKNTKASIDQEHIPFLLFNLPQIPDRTSSILSGNHKEIIEYLVYASRTLEKAGVKYILMACNTAHFYINDIQNNITAKIINLIDLVRKEIIYTYPYKTYNIGLIATEGTIKTKLYEYKNMKMVYPSKSIQNNYINKAIYGKKGIKAGYVNKKNKKLLLKAINYLIINNADIIILGCTEVPLVIIQKDVSIPIINPIDILAKKAIEIMSVESLKMNSYE